MDVEYFQVITGMTYSNYLLLTNQAPITSVTSWDNLTFNRRFLDNDTKIYNVHGYLAPGVFYNQFGGSASSTPIIFPPSAQYNYAKKFEGEYFENGKLDFLIERAELIIDSTKVQFFNESFLSLPILSLKQFNDLSFSTKL
jgi:hypothetical protein